MSSLLRVTLGQHSDRGRKPTNQDFHGACIPHEPQRASKGIVLALADGISSSDVSHIASETAVAGFLSDYFSTPDTWTVKTSAQRVLAATNAWLYAQTRQSEHRYDRDRGYVCTLSALILKATSAHLFHAGDSRIYRLRGHSLEPLTTDHRVSVAPGQSYLARAMGLGPHLELDYQAHALDLGDVFLCATDGVYEFVPARRMVEIVTAHGDDLEGAARALVQEAYAQGSDDNLTVQIVRIDSLPAADAGDIPTQSRHLPSPPLLQPRTVFEGYRIVREIHASHRSHVYLAVDEDTQTQVALKTPSIDQQDDAGYRERFLMEEWVARRIDNPHVVKAWPATRARAHLYTVSEYVEGQTLAQWMLDHPRPEIAQVRNIIEQVARGLQAFHRLEMLHQDLRPANLLIDPTGTVRILDFGAVRVAGMHDGALPGEPGLPLGTTAYMAPEYLLGEAGTQRSDIFSLAAIAYHLLTGHLPYGNQIARLRGRSGLRRLAYASAQDNDRAIPAWLDDVLRRALHPEPAHRYGELSEFVHDFRQPGVRHLRRSEPPWIERNPLMFWKALCLALAVLNLILLAT